MPSSLLLIALAALSLVFMSGMIERQADCDSTAEILSPPELGGVEWLREYEDAVAVSRDSGKPILMLFQEIPGCQTCVNFGQRPLSHPLIIEAIQQEFVPLAIHNNKPGRDAEILAKFNEPSWNNPVIRFIDANGKDVLPRQDRLWSSKAVADRLIVAIEASGREVPPYLALAAAELNTDAHQAATFAMHCYWDGEAKLGRIDGVITTKSGWLDGLEVVDLTFDPKTVDYATLVETAQSMACASRVFARDDTQFSIAEREVGTDAIRSNQASTDAKASDRKFALGRSALNYVPMTPMQATKVNAALRLSEDPRVFLSPGQIDLLGEVYARQKVDADAFKGIERAESMEALAEFERQIRAVLTDPSN